MNLPDTVPNLIHDARALRAELADVLLQLGPIPDDIDMISAIFCTGHAINGPVSRFILDQVSFFAFAGKSILNAAQQDNLRIHAELQHSLHEVLDELGGLIDVLTLCDLTSHFDHIDDFTRIAQRLLGTKRYKKMCRAPSLASTFQRAQKQLSRLIDVPLACAQAYLHLVPARRAASAH